MSAQQEMDAAEQSAQHAQGVCVGWCVVMGGGVVMVCWVVLGVGWWLVRVLWGWCGSVVVCVGWVMAVCWMAVV